MPAKEKKPDLTYGQLQKQLLAEAKLLLDIATEISTEDPKKEIKPDKVMELQQQYNDDTTEAETFAPEITRTGRARVSC